MVHIFKDRRLQGLTGYWSRHIVRVDFVPPGEDNDGDHDEAKQEGCNGGRHDGGCGQEEAVVDAEGSLWDEVHDHGEEGCHETDDNALWKTQFALFQGSML